MAWRSLSAFAQGTCSLPERHRYRANLTPGGACHEDRTLTRIFAVGHCCRPAGCAVAANAGTGARVVLQVWSPLSPDNQQERVLLDNPTLVSDLLQNQWSQVRQRICEQLRLEMGRGGFANGQTLRDIKCVLDERIALDVKRADQNALQATFSVNGYVEAT